MTETAEFVEVRCRQTGELVGVIAHKAVPRAFLEGAPHVRLHILQYLGSMGPCLVGKDTPRSLIAPDHTILAERMTFEWRDPRLALPQGPEHRLLLTFMMVDEDDIESLLDVRGFKPVTLWEDEDEPGVQ